MTNFIKESVSELEHVVWPTHIETKKFFQVVVSVIAGMTLFTYLLTLIFSNGMFEIRNRIHAPAKADLSGSPAITTQPLEITTADGQKVTATPVPVEAPKK